MRTDKFILGVIFVLVFQLGMSQTGIEVTPMEHDFGVVEVYQTSAPQEFMITNTGSETIIINDILIISSEFYIVGSSPYWIEIPPGDSSVFEVVFKPYKNCTYSGTMYIFYSLGQISIPLSGTGVVTAIDPPGVSIVGSEISTPFPKIDGNYVIWRDHVSGNNYDIYLYDISNGTTTNASNSPNHQDASYDIEGDYIVWRGVLTSPWGDYEIYAYEISSGNVINISKDPSHIDFGAHTDGEYVVWQKSVEDDVEIYVYNLSDLSSYNVSLDNINKDRKPRVSEQYVVWEKRIGTGYEYEIFVHNLQDGTTRNISNEPNFPDRDPRISGKYVVWTRNEEIYVHNLIEGTTINISNNPYYDRIPLVTEQYVVWSHWENGNYEIYAHNLIDGTTINVSNDPDNDDGYLYPLSISGNYVVWVKHGQARQDIYLHDLKHSFTFNISANPQNSDEYPEIYGDHIVWQKWGNNCIGYDVALFNLASVPELAISHIIDMINDLIDEGDLNAGAGNGLINKLNSILQKILDESNTNSIINQLCSFINQVNGLIPGQLSGDDGTPLIEAAREVIVLYDGDPDCNQEKLKSQEITESQTNQTISLNCFPNPFIGKTIVSFNTLIETHVTLSVFDVYGIKKVTILNETIQPGPHRFEVDGSDWVPGVYYIILQTGEVKETKQVILIR